MDAMTWKQKRDCWFFKGKIFGAVMKIFAFGNATADFVARHFESLFKFGLV